MGKGRGGFPGGGMPGNMSQVMDFPEEPCPAIWPI